MYFRSSVISDLLCSDNTCNKIDNKEAIGDLNSDLNFAHTSISLASHIFDREMSVLIKASIDFIELSLKFLNTGLLHHYSSQKHPNYIRNECASKNGRYSTSPRNECVVAYRN